MKFITIILLLFLLSGCATTQTKVGQLFQTNNAAQIKKDYHEIVKLLSIYKKKLDIRNPQNYDKKFAHYLNNELKNSSKKLFLQKDTKYINNFNDYLKIAMSKDEVKNRNDYLILGLYKQLYEAYMLNESHKITALGYDIDKLKELYYSLQVINWQIKSREDINHNYLFLTWQNNWQIELKKKMKNNEKLSWEVLESLEYIKLNKETLFSPSNSNFEVLMQQMIYRVQNSLKILGAEPLDVSIEIMKTLIFFL